MKILIVCACLIGLFTVALADDTEPSGGQVQVGRYLGNVNDNPFDPNSINNPFGRYGSPLSPDSINNPFSELGNPLNQNSPHNPFGTGGPVLVLPDD